MTNWQTQNLSKFHRFFKIIKEVVFFLVRHFAGLYHFFPLKNLFENLKNIFIIFEIIKPIAKERKKTNLTIFIRRLNFT